MDPVDEDQLAAAAVEDVDGEQNLEEEEEEEEEEEGNFEDISLSVEDLIISASLEESQNGSLATPEDRALKPVGSEHDTSILHHPYEHLREISSLASWTVSSSKPGCGVAALRHPNTALFWQSDGPQPHYLNIHFFRWVSIAHIRFYLDFGLDESYTPTKLQLWAGTGHHDLLMVTEMILEKPKGWLDVDLSRAGGPSEFREEENDLDDLDDELLDENTDVLELAKRQALLAVGRGSTLRCMLVQMRILENHQNGKDTHLRGLQLFCKDEIWAKNRRQRPRKSQGNEELLQKFSRLTKDEKYERFVEQTFAGTKHGEWLEEPTLR